MPMKTDKAGSYLITLRAAQKFIMGANKTDKTQDIYWGDNTTRQNDNKTKKLRLQNIVAKSDKKTNQQKSNLSKTFSKKLQKIPYQRRQEKKGSSYQHHNDKDKTKTTKDQKAKNGRLIGELIQQTNSTN